MADTSILNKQISDLNGIIVLKDEQLANDRMMFIQKDKAMEVYKEYYNDLYKTYNKSQKRLKFFKNTTVIFLSTTVLLGGLFVLVNK
jgi:hypothetical protein